MFVAFTPIIAISGCGKRGTDAALVRETPIFFRDVTKEAGLTFSRENGAFGNRWVPETIGGGGAFIDYDNDGYLDILLVNGDWYKGHPLRGTRPTLKLFHNNRKGTFGDVTDQLNLTISLQGMGVAVGDFDNDGYDDIFVSGVAECRLFHNEPFGKQIQNGSKAEQGKRRFRDITRDSGLLDSGWGTSAAWLDFDNDGLLDLIVCHYVKWTPETDVFCGVKIKTYCEPSVFSGDSCHLYRNLGNGRFKDVTGPAGLLTTQCKALGVCILDFDGDGKQDIFIANDLMPNTLYRNNGNGTFSNVALENGLAVGEMGASRAGMGVDSADCNGRGAQSLAVGNFTNEGMAYYDFSGPPPYSDTAKQAGIAVPSVPFVTFGVLFGDFDSDGYPDIFATNGHIEDTINITHRGQTYAQPGLLYRNLKNGTFADVSAASGPGITQPLVGRGACKGDFDNDGKVDLLLIPNIGPCRLLHNETKTENHWISIKLEGTKSNRNGYGAAITVEAGGRKQTALARSGSGYLSANDTRVFFGLGHAARIDRITVKWPSGLESERVSVPVDRVLKIWEAGKS